MLVLLYMYQKVLFFSYLSNFLQLYKKVVCLNDDIVKSTSGFKLN